MKRAFVRIFRFGVSVLQQSASFPPFPSGTGTGAVVDRSAVDDLNSTAALLTKYRHQQLLPSLAVVNSRWAEVTALLQRYRRQGGPDPSRQLHALVSGVFMLSKIWSECCSATVTWAALAFPGSCTQICDHYRLENLGVTSLQRSCYEI